MEQRQAAEVLLGHHRTADGSYEKVQQEQDKDLGQLGHT